MKVIIINKSDSTGGAAIVSYRLMEALRYQGVDAQMLVTEKLSDSPYVHLAASKNLIRRKFITERLKIFLSNGLRRSTLFKIDTGGTGLPLWRHPLVKSADAIMINWVNQGMLSIKGEKKILKLGKPVVWTMHDMWNMTGICHHAGQCTHFEQRCGDCPLLYSKASPHDLSHKVWKRKDKVYRDFSRMKHTAFVAVSNWLKDKSLQSSLLKRQRVEVIPNAFRIKKEVYPQNHLSGKIRILFGAARLDDPIKGLDTLIATTEILKKDYPDIADNLEIALFGNIKKPELLKNIQLPYKYLGILNGEEAIEKAYHDSQITLSASSYETLPGTLVEAQAYGCIPVSFRRGGQQDIINHLITGYLAEYDSDLYKRAQNLAGGVAWAVSIIHQPLKWQTTIKKMAENVQENFSYEKVAQEYINLLKKIG